LEASQTETQSSCGEPIRFSTVCIFRGRRFTFRNRRAFWLSLLNEYLEYYNVSRPRERICTELKHNFTSRMKREV